MLCVMCAVYVDFYWCVVVIVINNFCWLKRVVLISLNEYFLIIHKLVGAGTQHINKISYQNGYLPWWHYQEILGKLPVYPVKHGNAALTNIIVTQFRAGCKR